jgi:hypothetical protein
VTSVLVGCRTRRELDEDVRHLELEIPAGLWDELRHECLLPDDVPTP